MSAAAISLIAFIIGIAAIAFIYAATRKKPDDLENLIILRKHYIAQLGVVKSREALDYFHQKLKEVDHEIAALKMAYFSELIRSSIDTGKLDQ